MQEPTPNGVGFLFSRNQLDLIVFGTNVKIGTPFELTYITSNGYEKHPT